MSDTSVVSDWVEMVAEKKIYIVLLKSFVSSFELFNLCDAHSRAKTQLSAQLCTTQLHPSG